MTHTALISLKAGKPQDVVVPICCRSVKLVEDWGQDTKNSPFYVKSATPNSEAIRVKEFEFVSDSGEFLVGQILGTVSATHDVVLDLICT